MAKEKKLVEAITSMEERFCTMVYGRCKKSRALRLYKRKRLHGDQTCRLCHLGEYPE